MLFLSSCLLIHSVLFMTGSRNRQGRPTSGPRAVIIRHLLQLVVPWKEAEEMEVGLLSGNTVRRVCVCYEWEENQPGTRLSLVGAHEGSPFWILTWLMNQSRNDIVPPVKVTFFITPALAGLFTSATSLHATVVALLRFGRDDTLDWLSLKTKTKGKVGNIGLLIDSDLTFSSPVKSITKTAFVQLEIISRRKGRML